MTRKDIIKAEIDGNPTMQALGDNYPAIAALFNARPQVTNPAEQQQVAKRIGIRDLFAVITPSEERALESVWPRRKAASAAVRSAKALSK